MISLLAHQGGWDEVLLVLGPILIIAGLLRLAKRRVDRLQPQNPAEPTDTAADTAADQADPADTAADPAADTADTAADTADPADAKGEKGHGY